MSRQDERDRPAKTEEIEVTEEMVDSGEQALMSELGYTLQQPIPDRIMREAIVSIYRAMAAIRKG